MLAGYRTIIAAAVVFITEAFRTFGLIEAGDAVNTDQIVTSILILGGAIAAIVGRVKATKKIGGGTLK
jgi:hypothetical protein